MYPWYIRKEVREGKRSFVEIVEFDYENAIAVRDVTFNDGRKEHNELKLPGYVQDAVSLPFFLRRSDLKTNGPNKIYFYGSNSIEEISYEISNPSKTLNLDCGSFNNYYQIENAKNKITVIIANNSEKMPLIIRKITNFGKVESRLMKYQ
jgi:hypothetical protein